MLVHVEIPGMSLNLQDPLLRLTGIHPRQTGGPLFCQILTDFARGGRRANSTPGPARGDDDKKKKKRTKKIGCVFTALTLLPQTVLSVPNDMNGFIGHVKT